MSDVHMEIHPIFAKPIAVANFAPTKEMEKFLNSFSQEDYSNYENQQYGACSKNTKILREPSLSELRSVILKNSAEFARELLGIDTKEMVDILSWISLKRPGQIHVPHYHPNSIISGVYFFDDHTENMPLVFSETTAIVGEFILRPKPVPPEEMAKVPFPQGAQRPFAVSKGSLLLFPSYMKHHVDMNSTPFNRYSLAFNLMPKEGLGLTEELTRFDYEDVL